MKKRGFTLTELLGVIVVLGLIALIVFPNVNKSIKNSKKKLYDRQVEMIEENARKWGIDHSNLLPNSGSYYLELNDLITGGYITQKEIKDPRDESTMNGCIIISYNTEYNQYQYDYVSTSCGENKPASKTFAEVMNASTEVMANDPDGNKRYVGTNPDNYVKFNNELWRIIGVFNGQAKIIRNDFYNTSIPWDSNNINDWSAASLQNELNTTYLNGIEATSKSYIDQTHVWNLGGTANNATSTRAQFYTAERGTTVYSGRSTWTGAIGLMYPSDWGYASSSTNSICDTTALADWTETECTSNSWLHNSSTNQWTLTHRSDTSNIVFRANMDGWVYDNRASYTDTGARPVLYLKSNVKIESGTGSDGDPFILIQE